MPIPEIISFVGGWLADTASQAMSMFISQKLEEATKQKNQNLPAPIQEATQDPRLLKEQIAHQKHLQVLKREELAILQDRKNIEITRLEMEKAIAIDASQDRKRLLELKQEELRLAKIWQKKQEEIVLVEREFRARESALYRELLQELQSNEIKVKLQEIQANWDLANLPTILSREEMRQILLDAEKKYRLLILFSPPHISKDCPSAFRNNLEIEIPRELKAFMAQNYPLESDLCSVEFYGKFFKRDIFDIEGKQLEKILAPVPTVILYSAITDHKVYFDIGFWGLKNNTVSLIPNQPWDWEKAQKKLNEAGYDEKESLKIIRQLIITIHKLLAAFLADLYYLYVDFNYDPQLFNLASEFPLEWVGAFINILKNTQQQRREAYQQYLQWLVEQEAERERKNNLLERLRSEAQVLSEKGFNVVFEEVKDGYGLVLSVKQDLTLVFWIPPQYPHQAPTVTIKTSSGVKEIDFDFGVWQANLTLEDIISAFL